MADRPVTRNAGNKRDVAKATAIEEQRRIQELDDLRRVLATDPGRRVLMRILSHCRVFETITVQSSVIYTWSGMRDVGLFLMAQITAADELALLRMMQENMARERDERAMEIDSGQKDPDDEGTER